MATLGAAMVAEPGSPGEQILIKNLKGKTIALEIEKSDTIEEVRNNIQEKEHMPEYQQVLTYKGKNMDDDKQLN